MRRPHLLLLACLVCLLQTAHAAELLSDFGKLMNAFKSGREVRYVVEYKLCELFVDGKAVESVDAIGGATIEAWEYFAKGVVRNEKAYVATSHTVLISHPRHGHVYNYVRLRIYEDGAVEITARYLKTGTFEVVMDETFKGQLSNGKDKKAVRFFAD